MRGLRFGGGAVGAVLLLGVGAGSALAQAATKKPPAVQHELEGRSTCLMCHTAGVMEAVPDVPQNHAGRTNDGCLLCHAKDSPIQSGDPPAIPHELEGRAKCMMCHTAGAMEAVPDVPANHKGIEEKSCGLCHMPAKKQSP